MNYLVFVLPILLWNCSSNTPHSNNTLKQKETLQVLSKNKKTHDTCLLEQIYINKKLINIASLDSSIRVVLLYSTTHNFLNKSLYNGLTDCYLPLQGLIKLCNAQHFLKSQFPDYSIIVFDATRPLHIQKQMWEELDMPPKDKINYLAHPSDISLHNYGAAVDVGIIGNNDIILDMGTPFDYFGELSKPQREKEFFEKGKLSKEALNNRLLLRNVMLKAGFTTITSEWWHFNATNKTIAAARYELIE